MLAWAPSRVALYGSSVPGVCVLLIRWFTLNGPDDNFSLGSLRLCPAGEPDEAELGPFIDSVWLS